MTKPCGCCPSPIAPCDSCNYLVVLKFCGPQQDPPNDEYQLTFLYDGQEIDLGTISDNATDCDCRIFVIGVTPVPDAACYSVLEALIAEHGEDCVQYVPTTELLGIVSNSCSYIERFSTATIRILPLHGESLEDVYAPDYQIYMTCEDPVGCGLLKSGTAEWNDAVDSAEVTWPITCCERFCNSCCACDGGLYYYEAYTLVVSGVVTRTAAGAGACDCDQYNGTFVLRLRRPEDYPDCVYAEAGCFYTTDEASASPAYAADCTGSTTGDCAGDGNYANCGPDPYPLWVLRCVEGTNNGLRGTVFGCPSSDPIRFGITPYCEDFYADETTIISTDGVITGIPAQPAPCNFNADDLFTADGTPPDAHTWSVSITPLGEKKLCTTEMIMARIRRATMTPEERGDTRPARGPKKVPCKNLGDANGRTVDCPSCNGKVSLKLFVCTEYGECTLGKKADGVACCSEPGGCPGYVPAETEI